MKKRELKKLALNKETIAMLNRTAMSDSRGGAKPSKIGNSCHTGVCCYSKVECDVAQYRAGDTWEDED